MATNLHRVLENFIYQIEQISPTSTLQRSRFINFDPSMTNPDVARNFYVEWMDSDPDLSSSDSDRREASHQYRVHVFYPFILSWNKMHELISKDRHDLAHRLRRKQYCVGYSGNTSAEIGLLNRNRSGDELNKTGDVWELSIGWRCKISEDE